MITPTIVSSKAFRDNQRAMKELASRDPVHVTDNGSGAYVFCSEEVFRREVTRLADEIVYEREFEGAVARGLHDVASGRVFEGSVGDIMAEAARRARDDG